MLIFINISGTLGGSNLRVDSNVKIIGGVVELGTTGQIVDEDNKMKQWKEELEKVEESKVASNKWKDKEELARFIEKQAQKCRETKGNNDSSWRRRRMIIRALSGLTNLRGVKIGDKSGFEYIKELLEDKMNKENEEDFGVMSTVEECYILFISNNFENIDDLSKFIKEQAAKCREINENKDDDAVYQLD